MNNGVKSAIEYGVTNLIIVGDSRLAIQKSMGVIACRKETLQLKLSQHKELTPQLKSTRYLHVVRAYNAAADSLATEALESQVTKVVLSESRKTELKALNKIPEVLYVDEEAIAETNLPAQRIQPIPQNETHAESQTVEEPQATAVTRNQSRRMRFAESTKHRPTSQEAVNEVDNLPADQDSPVLPQGGAQRSAGKGTRNLETTFEPARADPKEVSEREGPTTVQTERIRLLRVAQDEERGKLADRFVLDEDGLLQYVGIGRKLDVVGEHEPQLRLVIPTTMIDEVLQSCHDSIEGGHQGITHCSTSKGKPHLKGYSPGNVLAERPFQLLAMDFVTPLPKTRRGNTSLLLFQCSFTGFVIAKAMSSTEAQDVAEVFEEYVFRRFGAPTMIRHDRDPSFMSETFKASAELIQARSRATLSYRPQANGQQERSVKSIVQTVNVYVEDPLQQD
ncbi:unnamed protein product [Phytophthora fragariaefolia]|uniref:Unnamed protein product n=1 Tax=Phytophthora fragariaefolia TaxID=1490495 RepID=A0A9W6YB50_9STRA|nr:unnamed protein product [Phytophthora fragariaefolia]